MQTLRFLPLAWLLLGTLASAQLDLPNQMRGAKRDQTSKVDKNGLVLPRSRNSGGEASEPAASPENAAEAAPAEAAEPVAVGLTERAAQVIEELGTLERYESDRTRVFAAQLETLGDPGLQAARAALQLDGATALAVATRVLLRNGDEADRDQLWRRLEGRLPAPATHAMLSTASDADPTYLTDARLVALLDHPQGVMRAAAERQLEERSRIALLPTLMPALESDRTDTRQRAVELVAEVVDPTAVPLLLSRLSDDSAKVAFRAAELLADFPTETVVPELLERVRATRRMFRSDCYALLSLVEREDRQGIGILDETYVPQLLENLRASEPFARGSAAVALAGIGFRSADREQTAWLDKEVPEQLLSIVVGNEFHRDYSSLLRPTRRRLSLISGERFGADGPAWARWWLDSNATFRPRRATIDVQPGDELSLTLAFRGAIAGAEAFVLAGPDAPLPEAVLGEVIYIGPDEAAALARDLGRFGVFGPERLPGHYGGGATVQTLEVRIAGQDKRFSFSESADQEWFLETLSNAREIHGRNRWQRFFDAESFASRRAFWEQERAWWVEPRTPEERERRLVELILQVLSGSRSGDRDVLVEELTLLCGSGDLLGIEDSARLRRVLSNELFFGDRAEALLDLTLMAMSQTPSGVVDPQVAAELFDDVYELFKETALDGLEQIAASTDSSFAEQLASDRRPVARGVAAQRLAKLGGPSQIERLAELLDDDIEVVQASAVEAIGRAGVDELETDVLVRARIGSRLVRMAALRAAG
ncbi:MAG: HEAT repeat domain-containing protein, partial [Planctomycetota bacterium]